jgi:hypothetical protein
MKKLFPLILLLFIFKAYSQNNITANMHGRWRTIIKNDTTDMQFFESGKHAFISTEGVSFGYILYTTEVKEDIIKLKYTFDVDRKKNRNYAYAEMKFLNDSTLLYAFGKLPANADTNTKSVKVYRKLRQQKPNTAFRQPNYHDFAGAWIYPFKGEITGRRIVFIDSVNVMFQKNGIEEKATYKVDFTKQPAPIDFYHPTTGKTEQALIQFWTNNFRIEWYHKGNRSDHFSMFGENNGYVRESTYQPKQK